MSDKLKLQVRWDNILQKVSNMTTSWNSTPSDDKYPSEKLVKDSLDDKLDVGDAFTWDYEDLNNTPTIPTSTSELSNDGEDGNNSFIDDSDSRLSDSRTPLSHSHGYITNDGKLNIQNDSTDFLFNTPIVAHTNILSNTSDIVKGYFSSDYVKLFDDLTNLNIDGGTTLSLTLSTIDTAIGNKANSNHTHGNLQNNGQVGGTAQSNKNVVTDSNGLITTEDKPTIPTASSTTPSADTTSGSVGNGTTWARSNHTHPKSSIYASSTHTHSPSDINSIMGIGIINEYDDLNSEFDSNFNATGGGAVLFDSLIYSNDEDSLLTYDESRNWSKIATLNDIPSSSTTLGNAYYCYELSSSHYNPPIDSTVTLTCKVTNVFGNNVANKTLTLYHNGVSLGTATTDANGEATWSYTFNDWDTHHFNCNGATMELSAKGWKTLLDSGGYLIRTKDNRVQFNLNVDSVSFPTTFTAFGGGAKVPTGYRPYRSVVVPCKSNYPLFVAIMTDGTVERRTFNSSQQTAGAYAFAEWTI